MGVRRELCVVPLLSNEARAIADMLWVKALNMMNQGAENRRATGSGDLGIIKPKGLCASCKKDGASLSEPLKRCV